MSDKPYINPKLASVAWRSSQSGRARNDLAISPLVRSFLALPDWLEREASLDNPKRKLLAECDSSPVASHCLSDY